LACGDETSSRTQTDRVLLVNADEIFILVLVAVCVAVVGVMSRSSRRNPPPPEPQHPVSPPR